MNDITAAATTSLRAASPSMFKVIGNHIRKVSLEIVNAIFNHDCLFKAVGKLNRRFGFLKTVFVAYPASQKYSEAYVYKSRQHRMKWRPQPVGFYVQNGKLGLMCVVSSTESDFWNQDNFNSLQGMADRMDEIQEMVGADHKAFSGILPSVMKRSGIKTDVTPKATVMAVTEATINLMKMESIPDSTAVYILGGHGYIGKRVIRELSDRGIIAFSVDTSSGNDGLTSLPDSLPKSKHLVVNIASPNALKGSIRHLQEGTVVLNEAYPEPDAKTIASLKGVGCHLYHVVGVKAKACPQFPYAYRGGIPCCAAWPSPDAKVNVMRLA